MCHMLYLVSSDPLPTIYQNSKYPQLTVKAVPEDYRVPSKIRELIPQAKYIYNIHPNDLCGCYFEYEKNDEREANLNDYINDLQWDKKLSDWLYKTHGSIEIFKQKQFSFWQECRDAVTSFGCYLHDCIHLTKSLMLYMTWCGDEGKPIIEQKIISPSSFSGESCYPWSKDTLYTIRTEKVILMHRIVRAINSYLTNNKFSA